MRESIFRVAAVLTFLCAAATAGTIAYDNTCPSASCAPNENFGNSLGLDFEVNSQTNVLALGMYDGGNDSFQSIFAGVDGSSGITVLIYQIASPGCASLAACAPSLVTSVHFDPSQFVSGNYPGAQQIDAEDFLYLSSPAVLQPGYYSIVTWNDWNWNSNGGGNPWTTLNDGGGVITFDGAGRFDPTGGCPFTPGCPATFDFPITVDGGPDDRYMAGSFIFGDTPEPSTLGLIGAGLIGVWALRRRRRA